jgi:hypothetical protein
MAHMSHFTTHDLPSFLTPDWGTSGQLQSESSLGDVFAPEGPTSVATQRPVSSESQPLSITSLDIAAADATQGDPDVSTSSLTQPIPQPISPGGSASQRSEDLTIVPSPVVSDSAPPPIPMSTVTQTNPVDLSPDLEPPYPQPGDIPWVSRSLSSPLVDPHLASDSDSQIIETSTPQHDTRDVDPSAPIEAFHRHPPPPAVADPDTSESVSRPEDYGHDSNQSSLRLTNGP